MQWNMPQEFHLAVQLRPVHCYVETAASITSKYDLACFGAEVIRGTPREADLIVIAGTVFIKMAPVIQRLYEQMMEPLWSSPWGPARIPAACTTSTLSCRVSAAAGQPDAASEGGGKRTPALELGHRAAEYRASAHAVCARREASRAPASNSAEPAGGSVTAAGFQAAVDAVKSRLEPASLIEQPARDGIPTCWVTRDRVASTLSHLKNGIEKPCKFLYDITAIDERVRTHRGGRPAADFTIVYHLFSYERNEYVRIKTPLDSSALSLDSITRIWSAANWYEREVWDMFGITFSGRTHLARILMPLPGWAIPCVRIILRAPPKWVRFACPRIRRKPSRGAAVQARAVGMRRSREDADKVWRFRNVIKLKRIYEQEAKDDGARYLVERLWPRGVKKESLHLDGWLKDVGPSTDLRQWFSHDPTKWQEFRRKYFAELDRAPEVWAPLHDAARQGTVTLLYSSHDAEHNNAVALKEYIEHKIGARARGPHARDA